MRAELKYAVSHSITCVEREHAAGVIQRSILKVVFKEISAVQNYGSDKTHLQIKSDHARLYNRQDDVWPAAVIQCETH